MTYEQYEKDFKALLTQFMQCDPGANYPKLIFGAESNILANKMADMEEAYPEYAEQYASQYN